MPTAPDKMRVTILWSHWSGYMAACVQALADAGASVAVYCFKPLVEAPYDEDRLFAGAVEHVSWDPTAAFPCEEDVIGSEPTILLVGSWHIRPYRRIARKLRGRSTRLLAMDNQWRSTLRQRLGSVVSPVYISPLFDFAFVPGPRQRIFARHLGFDDGSIIESHYSCDYRLMADVFPQRMSRPLSKKFVFVGRMIEEKGIDVLRRSWIEYRRRAKDPWGLQLFGAGPLSERFADLTGVSREGFVQPSRLPAALLNADALVLPSLWEPWGVVIHEAAATGMPIICSDACGAGDLFVQRGMNGFIVRAGDAGELCAALLELSARPEGRIRAMETISFDLAAQRTPTSWARAVLSAANP